MYVRPSVRPSEHLHFLMDFKSKHIYGLPMTQGFQKKLIEPDWSTNKKVFSISTILTDVFVCPSEHFVCVSEHLSVCPNICLFGFEIPPTPKGRGKGPRRGPFCECNLMFQNPILLRFGHFRVMNERVSNWSILSNRFITQTYRICGGAGSRTHVARL